MKATKHFENGSVIVYYTEGKTTGCLVFDNEKQLARLGECLKDLARVGGNQVEIVPNN